MIAFMAPPYRKERTSVVGARKENRATFSALVAPPTVKTANPRRTIKSYFYATDATVYAAEINSWTVVVLRFANRLRNSR